MATFHLQVEGLTSLAIDGTSTPTEAELSQFLIDGVLEVTTKWLLVSPQDRNLFVRESAEYDSNSSSPFSDEVDLVSVLREAGTTGDFRFCKEIPVALESRAQETSSLFYASKYHPVYTRNANGVIKVFPEPTGGGANSYKVLYINNEPKGDGTSDSLAHGHSAIGYFPSKLVNLVVMYASIKALEAKIASFTIDDEDSELVQSLSNSYNNLRGQYDQYFGLKAKAMQPKQQPAPQEQTQQQPPQEQEE